MYNCKIYDYGGEKQYRFYKKMIMKSEKKQSDEQDKETKTDENNKDNKTEEKKLIVGEKSVDEERSIISSLNRTVNKVYEYARANKWEYFVTLTFNSTIDRYSYDDCSACMIKFLKVTRKHNPDMQYIIVPELHEDGAYHFHGVFSNIPNVKMEDSGVYSFGKYTFKRENIPLNLINKCRLIYNMERYKYGYSDIQFVENSEKTANYITKYITKELVAATKNKKRYWNSRNLNKPVITELMLTKEEIETLKMLIGKQIINQKTVNIEVGDYDQLIEYIDIKTNRTLFL